MYRVSALIAVILAAILVSTVQVATGQQKTTTNSVFLTYKDPAGGFKLLYPSNWITSASSPSDAVFDSVPVKIGEPIKSVRIEISVRNVDQYLDEKQMILKNKTAYDYVASTLKGAGYDPQFDMTTRPIRVNSTTVAGINAWRIDFMLTTGSVFHDETFFRKTYMVNNGKLYEFSYMAPPLKVPATLPIAQKMFDSFEFIKK
jgi:PsbP